MKYLGNASSLFRAWQAPGCGQACRRIWQEVLRREVAGHFSRWCRETPTETAIKERRLTSLSLGVSLQGKYFCERMIQ